MMWDIVGAAIILYLICLSFLVVGKVVEFFFPSLKRHEESSEL